MENQKNWLKSLRKGERVVFEELYSYGYYCTKIIIKNGASPEQAEDIFQDAIMVLYKNVVKDIDFTLTSDIKTYLVSIMKNLWSNKSRKKDNNVLPLLDNIEQMVNLADLDTEKDEWQKEKHQALIETIEKLSPKCREVLTLFYWEGLTLDEIAQFLSTKKSSVQTEKSRCLSKWKTLNKPNR